MDALFAWLWQGGVLTIAVAVALRLATRVSAATRHVVWWVTLAGVVALPAVSLVGTGPALGAPDRQSFVEAGAPFSPPAADASVWALPAPPDWAIAIALGAWLGFVVLSAVRVARGVVFVRALARRSLPIAAAREARLPMWSRRRRDGRPVSLRVSDEVQAPCALGLGPATIVLPRYMLTRFADAELDQLVMHERAHLLRYDDWTRLAEAVVTSLAGVHPAVGWICRQIDLERETAADDLVVQETGDPRGFATCLASAASAVIGVGRDGSPSLAPGAWRARRPLERRVRRLLDWRRTRRISASRPAVFASVCVLAAVSVALVQAAPVVRFVAEALPEPVPPVAGSDGSGRRPAPALAVASADAPGSTPDAAVVPPSRVAPGRLQRTAASAVTARSRAGQQVAPPSAPGPAPTSGHLLEPPADREAAPSEQVVTLESNLPVEVDVRPAHLDVTSTPPGIEAPGPRGERSPWSGVARAGTSVGAGAKKASVAVAGFFARAGQAVGDSFQQ
jgi:beta-lactamase regulating signal transducer with metallopeptidase domain